ncbi:MAG: ChaN family lipoprotein, partial [Planctomycetes bacterium]|nr:ChaN family lipoprotein [Planctomycetota bacterium]
GLLDEQSFLAQSRPWANYERDYRPVVEFAKAHNLVVLAANLPRPLASRVAKEGFAAVAGGPHVARESTAPEDDYWEWFRSTMGSHPGVTEERMRSFYAAQCAKDDTMAESITDHLKERRAAGDKPLVVFVCGRGHSDHGWGTVARIKSRMPDLDVRVLSAEMVADVDIGPMVAPKTVGDYVIASPVVAHDEPSPVAKAKPVEKGPTATKPATKPIDAKPTEAKPAVPAAQPEPAADDENLQPALGLMPDYAESGEGVKVESVRGGGAAEKAGIEAGDVIVALAGTKITDVQHYSDLLKEQKIGASITVRVRREGVEVDLQVKVGSRPRTR